MVVVSLTSAYLLKIAQLTVFLMVVLTSVLSLKAKRGIWQEESASSLQ
jgi:hypothetical protein